MEKQLKDRHKYTHPHITLNTQKNYTKKVLIADNHNGVVTHLEPDILECEVKWASGSLTAN